MDEHASDGLPGAEFDDERVVDETAVDDALPERIDADFEEPIPDVIDQRREVVLDDDRDGTP